MRSPRGRPRRGSYRTGRLCFSGRGLAILNRQDHQPAALFFHLPGTQCALPSGDQLGKTVIRFLPPVIMRKPEPVRLDQSKLGGGAPCEKKKIPRAETRSDPHAADHFRGERVSWPALRKKIGSFDRVRPRSSAPKLLLFESIIINRPRAPGGLATDNQLVATGAKYAGKRLGPA